MFTSWLILCFPSYLRRWRYHEYLRNIANVMILLCFPSHLTRWRYHEYLRNIVNITMLLCVSIVFEPLDAPWIPPERC
jgi:hypothetical protein